MLSFFKGKPPLCVIQLVPPLGLIELDWNDWIGWQNAGIPFQRRVSSMD